MPAAIVFTDFSKAYETLDRGWLRRCLVRLGFPAPFLRWVDLLLADNTNRLLINGWLSSAFPLHRGVRQGCPMSPTLFNVFIDFLARLVAQRCHAKGVRGFRVAFKLNGQLQQIPAFREATNRFRENGREVSDLASDVLLEPVGRKPVALRDD